MMGSLAPKRQSGTWRCICCRHAVNWTMPFGCLLTYSFHAQEYGLLNVTAVLQLDVRQFLPQVGKERPPGWGLHVDVATHVLDRCASCMLAYWFACECYFMDLLYSKASWAKTNNAFTNHSRTPGKLELQEALEDILNEGCDVLLNLHSLDL